MKAEDRKRMPVYSGVLKYFPDALKEVSKCSLAGNEQHHPDKALHWDKNKSTDNEDAMIRHLIDHSVDPMDDDGVLHLAKVAWRALASLQIYLDKRSGNIDPPQPKGVNYMSIDDKGGIKAMYLVDLATGDWEEVSLGDDDLNNEEE